MPCGFVVLCALCAVRCALNGSLSAATGRSGLVRTRTDSADGSAPKQREWLGYPARHGAPTTYGVVDLPQPAQCGPLAVSR